MFLTPQTLNTPKKLTRLNPNSASPAPKENAQSKQPTNSEAQSKPDKPKKQKECDVKLNL